MMYFKVAEERHMVKLYNCSFCTFCSLEHPSPNEVVVRRATPNQEKKKFFRSALYKYCCSITKALKRTELKLVLFLFTSGLMHFCQKTTKINRDASLDLNCFLIHRMESRT